MDDEKTWIQQALQGNKAAFARLIEAYQAPVFNLAYRILGDPAEAEDAAQETFVRVYTRLRTYEPERKFSSWILSITSHYCIDCLRRRHGSHVSLDDVLAQQAFADPGAGPERQALQRESQESVHAMIAQLPAPYRVVLALRYWQDLSYDEMAEMLGTTASAVKSRLHRARCLLAEQMNALDAPAGAQAAEPEPPTMSIRALKPEKEAVQHALSASH